MKALDRFLGGIDSKWPQNCSKFVLLDCTNNNPSVVDMYSNPPLINGKLQGSQMERALKEKESVERMSVLWLLFLYFSWYVFI